jgi:hypothetical protein
MGAWVFSGLNFELVDGSLTCSSFGKLIVDQGLHSEFVDS